MSVYAKSNIYSGEVQSPDVVPGYVGEAGVFKALADNAYNDLKLFEAVLGCDFQEEAAIKESADVEAIQEASFQGMLDKVVAFFKSLWAKVKSIFESFIAWVKTIFIRDGKKLVEATKKRVHSLTSEQLKKITIKGYRKVLITAMPIKDEYKWDGKDWPDIVNNDSLVRDALTKALEEVEAPDFKLNLVKGISENKINPSTYSEIAEEMEKLLFDDAEDLDGITSAMLKAAEADLIGGAKAIKNAESELTKTNKNFTKILKQIEDSKKVIAKGEYKAPSKFSPGTQIPIEHEKSIEMYTKRASLAYKVTKATQEVIMDLSAYALTFAKMELAQQRKIWSAAATFNPVLAKESGMLGEMISTYEFALLEGEKIVLA